jgi:hypothetical protein
METVKITISFLNFESVLILTISNRNFEQNANPGFILGFGIGNKFSDNEIFDRIKTMSFEASKLNELNVFTQIHRELKTIFDCRMEYNGQLEDCESVTRPIINIVSLQNWKTNELKQLLKMKYKSKNESLIEILVNFGETLIFVNYPILNSRRLDLNESISENLFPKNARYLENAPIIQISTNFNKISTMKTLFGTDDSFFKVLFKSNIEEIYLNRNTESLLTKKTFEYLETPYASRCSYYDKSRTVFDSVSNEHCIQQCLRNYCETKLNCSCYVINIFGFLFDTISQTHNLSNNLQVCELELTHIKYFHKFDNYTKFCTDLCPIDCIQNEFIITQNYKNKKIYSDPKFWKFKLFWDESKPHIINKEIPVMTLTDYFCYIGGLFGMWFGISAHQVLDKLKENYSIYYRNFINYSLILFYTSLEILFVIKTKFLSIIRYFYSCFQII